MTVKRVLHVGSGAAGREETHHRFRGPAWEHTRLDIDPSVNPDIVGNIVTLDNIETESFDGLYSSHNLEHLQFYDVQRALSSFHRVLKDRGLLVIAVPNFALACQYVADGNGLKPIYNSPAGPITPFDMIFGYRPFTESNPHQQHKSGFTRKWLQEALADIGFVGIEVHSTDNFDLWAFARKMA